MKVIITRDSVCAGDDVDAPHNKKLSIPNETPVREIIRMILSLPYLANIVGGKATWIATSNLPLAVVAQQWPEPKFVYFANDPVPCFSDLNYSDDTLQIHFKYLAQQDPNTIFEIITNQIDHAP